MRKGVSRPDGRAGKRRKVAGEESPGSIGMCRIASGGGNPRESATENEPLPNASPFLAMEGHWGE